MSEPPSTLWQVFGRFRLSEILGWDLLAGVASSGVAVWAASTGRGAHLITVAPVAVGLAGITVAAVVAALALVASFMSPQFLRNLAIIDRDPTDYIAPFLATVVLGIIASLIGLVLTALSTTAPVGWLGSIGAATAFFTVWAMASLIRGLNTLVQFVRLQVESAAVRDQ